MWSAWLRVSTEIGSFNTKPRNRTCTRRKRKQTKICKTIVQETWWSSNIQIVKIPLPQKLKREYKEIMFWGQFMWVDGKDIEIHNDRWRNGYLIEEKKGTLKLYIYQKHLLKGNKNHVFFSHENVGKPFVFLLRHHNPSHTFRKLGVCSFNKACANFNLWAIILKKRTNLPFGAKTQCFA